jgi:hypothetical protein
MKNNEVYLTPVAVKMFFNINYKKDINKCLESIYLCLFLFKKISFIRLIFDMLFTILQCNNY